VLELGIEVGYHLSNGESPEVTYPSSSLMLGGASIRRICIGEYGKWIKYLWNSSCITEDFYQLKWKFKRFYS
jgi:hypothetical protein